MSSTLAPIEAPEDVARFYEDRRAGKRLGDQAHARIRDWEEIQNLYRLVSEGVALSPAGQARIESFEQGRADDAAERERQTVEAAAAIETAEAELLEARAAVEKVLAPLALTLEGAAAARVRYEMAWSRAYKFGVAPVRLHPNPGLPVFGNILPRPW